MYIKLGETAINRVANTNSSFMIVSELIDSGLSYEKPVLVKTVDELDIWFTQDFKERNYLIELLNRGINLYLYKPISSENKSDIPDQIDYDSYTEIKFFFNTTRDRIVYEGTTSISKDTDLSLNSSLFSGLLTEDTIRIYVTGEGNYSLYYTIPNNSGDDIICPVSFKQDDYSLIITVDKILVSTISNYGLIIKSSEDWELSKIKITNALRLDHTLLSNTVNEIMLQYLTDLKLNNQLRFKGIDDIYYRWDWKNNTESEKEGNFKPLDRIVYEGTTSISPGVGVNIEPNLFNQENNELILEDIIKIYVTGNGNYSLFYKTYNEETSEYILHPIQFERDNYSLMFKVNTDDLLNNILKYGLVLGSSIEWELTKIKIITDEKNYQDWFFGETIPKIDFSDLELVEDFKKIKEKDEIKIFVLVTEGGTEPYIWFDNQFVSASLLPQNIENTSSSLNLRSTLLLSSGNENKLYSHPEYITGKDELGTFSTENIEFISIDPMNPDPDQREKIIKLKDLKIIDDNDPYYYKLNLDKIWEGYQTFMYNLEINDFPNGGYIILPRPFNPETNPYEIGKGIFIYRTDDIIDEHGNRTKDPIIWNKIKNELKIKETSESLSSPYFDSSPETFRIIGNDFISEGHFDLPSAINSIVGWIRRYFNADYPVIQYDSVDNPYLIKNLGCYCSSPNIVRPYPVTEFTNIKDVKFINRYDINETIIYNSIGESNKGIEFWSKTIGGIKSYDINGDIKVEIEELEKNYYKIRLSRYDYLEIFEGFTSGVFGNERLDYKITNESKLVYCNIINPTLKEGSFLLKGGKIEDCTPEMWNKALSVMFDEDNEPVWPDFHLVPNIQDYENLEEYYNNSEPYLPIYKTFLNYAEKFTTQFLIQNLDLDNGGYTLEEVSVLPEQIEPNTIYKIGETYRVFDSGCSEITDEREVQFIVNRYNYGNDYFTNYTKDTSNYLIYFYRGMSIYGNPRPGYYAFLEGLLTNNYTISSKVIFYNQPTVNPYITEPIEKSLEKYKSNYLVSNNQYYYYKKYQNGDNFYMTLWMRFTAGKINRELQKNKKDYLGIKFSGKMERVINTILQTIEGFFSIIKKIEITAFSKDEEHNTLAININVYVNDLINNNLNLNITINYNNYNNYGIS